jgi:hypothetical protein
MIWNADSDRDPDSDADSDRFDGRTNCVAGGRANERARTIR